MLLLLNVLSAEQLADIHLINHPSVNNIRRIRADILVSSEIACSPRAYENVSSDARFRKQMKAIVIDEVKRH
jgi:hypothetical protein